MKMLTYMSYGLPCVSSTLSFKNTFFKTGKEILVYKNNNDFVSIIKKLKEDKYFSKRISKFSLLALKKKYSEKKIFSVYDKIIWPYLYNEK